MSADTVTDAIVAWLSPPYVVGLNKVYAGPPWFEGAPAWNLDSELGWGAVGLVHIARESEHRIAMGGPDGGLKQVDYEIGLFLHFKYVIPENVDPDTEPVGYTRPLNGLLDGIRRRLRADRTLGTAAGLSGMGGVEVGPEGAIIQVAEGDGSGGPDIVVNRDIPKRDVGIIWNWSLVEFHVVEIVAA
jgi:hypothetical protein